MLAIASKIILCLVLAALLGLIIGYILGKSNCPKSTFKGTTPGDPHTEDDDDCGGKQKQNRASESSGDTEAKSAPKAQALKSSGSDSVKPADTQKAAKKEKDTTTKAEQKKNENDNKPKVDTAKESSKNATTDSDTKNKGKKTPANKDKKQEKPKDAKSNEKTQTPQPSDADKPASLLSSPRGGKKDDLKKIKGIGVKIEELLNETGVYHFDQIAAWSEKEAEWIDHKVSFPGRAKRDDWIGQAKLLAQGKETEFSKRVEAGEVATSKK